MRLYSGPSRDFIDDSIHNRITDKLKTAYFNTYRREAARSEVGAWRNSLRAVSQVFEAARFLDHGVLLEYELPMNSRRLDCMITGQNDSRRDNAVIIELNIRGQIFSIFNSNETLKGDRSMPLFRSKMKIEKI